jgi:surface antigen
MPGNCKTATVFVALVLSATSAISSADAQLVSPFRGSGIDLSQEDLRLAEAAAKNLYAADIPKIGASEAWSNTRSGNSGTVTLREIYTWQNLPCRRIEHHLVGRNRRDPFVVQIHRCRDASGEWKIRSL